MRCNIPQFINIGESFACFFFKLLSKQSAARFDEDPVGLFRKVVQFCCKGIYEQKWYLIVTDCVSVVVSLMYGIWNVTKIQQTFTCCWPRLLQGVQVRFQNQGESTAAASTWVPHLKPKAPRLADPCLPLLDLKQNIVRHKM